MRYRFLPYWYTLAWQANQTGYPLIRPLFWAGTDSEQLWDIDDSFLVGEHLLVAPILEEGALSRSVLLPEGDWYDYYQDALFHGAQEIVAGAVLERTPVFVRAGTILPLALDDHLELHIYRTRYETAHEGVLYSDQGDGFGLHRLDIFRLEVRENNRYQFSWKHTGDYRFPYLTLTLKLHGFDRGSQIIGDDNNPIPVGEPITLPGNH